MIETGNARATLRTQVCVIGSGPAGITVALELERRGVDCVLLESGGRVPDREHAALNETPQVGITTDPTLANRVRALGGTSVLWGGMCRPLDAMDFLPRPWVPESGWPLSREDLLPYYDTAHQILGIPGGDYDLARLDPARGTTLPLTDDHFDNVVFRYDATPMRFGEHYAPHLEASKRIRTFLDSTVVDLATDLDGRRVVAADVVGLSGDRSRVEAQRFVLATGAINTAKLLLNSDSVHETGLGNRGDRVGRNFLQHPVWRAPYMLTFSETASRRIRRSDMSGNVIVTAIQPGSARQHGLLNFHVLAKLPQPAPGIDQGRVALRYWRNRLERMLREPVEDADVGEYLTQLDASLAPSRDPQPLQVGLEMRPEQAPNPDSRIVLDDARDAVGMRRARMDWRLTDLDRESMWTGMRMLVRSLARQGVGRVNITPEQLRPPEAGAEYLHGGHHQFGTTRMSDSPASGVVDRHCRVHGVENLYVAGSAVFPTTGYANPTLTIVALAARVAEHAARPEPAIAVR